MTKDDTLAFLYSRRSVRKFTDQPVERLLLMDLTRAAMAAPSAVNRQPWAFVLIDDRSVISECEKVVKFSRHGAPSAVVVCGDLKRALPAASRDFWVQDCSAATENLLLAASGFGLGAVWCGVYPIQSNMDGLRSILRLPDHIVPLSYVCVGWPVDVPSPGTKFDEGKVFFNAWDDQKASRAPRFGMLRLILSFFK